MKKGFSVAIDGPVASGKGTLAEALAKKLRGYSINTGGMYRALALYCLENNINTGSESEVANVLGKVVVDLIEDKVLLNGKDVSDRLKESDISATSSILASYGLVRNDLANRQRSIAEKLMSEGRAVLIEGRDIGTRVMPDADLKIFLTADENVRAQRRHLQYKQKGILKNFEEVLEETKSRDRLDSSRETDPLTSDPESMGYWVLDDSGQDEQESISAILSELQKRGLING